MKAVVQRVEAGAVYVGDELVSEIGGGLVVYLGIKRGDGEKEAEFIANKISRMRIFADENGKMNLSVKDVGGSVLLVSQFTLLGDARHGNRPSFSEAESPVLAEPLYESVADEIRKFGIEVKTGLFGADMRIPQTNIGPVTILLDTE